jgi:hypothetical protein
MGKYPILCDVCSNEITSKEDHIQHITRHTGEVSLLAKSLAEEHENENSLSPEAQTRRPLRGHEARRWNCPERGCAKQSNRGQHALRHLLTRKATHLGEQADYLLTPTDYDWNKPCQKCEDMFTSASVFTTHACQGQTATQAVINERQNLVAKTLKLSITHAPVQRGKRIRHDAPDPAYSFQPVTINFGAQVNSSSDATQIMEQMPSAPLSISSASFRALDVANGNMYQNPSLSFDGSLVERFWDPVVEDCTNEMMSGIQHIG